jgi:entry exclusion lipoprotein TrbK
MKTKKALTLALAALVVALIAGCGEKPPEQPVKQAMPEVNDENCTPTSIAKIENKGMQQAFSSLCLRRGGGFKPSEKKEW